VHVVTFLESVGSTVRAQRERRGWSRRELAGASGVSERFLAQLEAGETHIRSMVPKIYAGVDPRLYPAAAHSVLAHVIELVRTGRVASEGPPTVDSELRLVAPTG